jgi:DNA-binding beta-propeller fold protein YncE
MDQGIWFRGRNCRVVYKLLLLIVIAGAGGTYRHASQEASRMPPAQSSDAAATSLLDTPFELVNYQPLDGMQCPLVKSPVEVADTWSAESWELASARFLEAQQAAKSSASSASPARPLGGDLRPVRTVEDPYSTFAAIAVDPVNDEVIMSDENRFNLLVYGRTINPKGVAEPRRQVGGLHSKMEFICGVAVDPLSREIYTVNNDTLDNLVVFSPDARGDVPPARELHVDHGAWGISLDREHDEIAVTIEHYNKVSFYSRTAQGDAGALRYIQGPQTGLADPHGVHVDTKHDEVVVTNHGAWHLVQPGQGGSVSRGGGTRQRAASSPRPSSWGRFDLPSVRIFARTASGDVAPLRSIQGPHTKLSLPQGVFVDPESGQILVANDGGNSILFFARTAEGDVAPVRTLEGPATGINTPNGVAVDSVHHEIWVSNWATHSATVYPIDAQGNTAPLRTIRSAPENTPQPGLGNPGAVGYDSKKQEIVVPN